MTKVESISLQPTPTLAETGRKIRQSWIGRRPEMAGFMVLLAWLSLPAVFSPTQSYYVFLPQEVLAGQWWRLLTHPFVHVSWYHLLLDGAAFFMLYHSLTEKSFWRRMGIVFGGAMGSVLLSWAFGPTLATQGLCGLSGIAHGLMAVSAVEQMSADRLSSSLGRVGLVSFLFVVVKAGLEGATGHLFFAWLHFGLLGNPIVVSHAGGIIGSLVAYLLFRKACRKPTASAPLV